MDAILTPLSLFGIFIILIGVIGLISLFPPSFSWIFVGRSKRDPYITEGLSSKVVAVLALSINYILGGAIWPINAYLDASGYPAETRLYVTWVILVIILLLGVFWVLLYRLIKKREETRKHD